MNRDDLSNPNSTVYTPSDLRKEAISAVRSEGRENRRRVRFVNYELQVLTGRPPRLLARGRYLDGGHFVVIVAI